jgi:hypothetical protein
MSIMPERIDELTKAVQTTRGYESWRADYRPESLSPLGDWFSAQVQTRQRTPEEIEEKRTHSKFPFDVPPVDLTNRTFSLAMDIGMYLSEVFLKNHSDLRWSQPLGSKNHIDYGQPVLEPFDSSPFNPVSMMVTLAYGLTKGTKEGSNLRQIYQNWVKRISKAQRSKK